MTRPRRPAALPHPEANQEPEFAQPDSGSPGGGVPRVGTHPPGRTPLLVARADLEKSPGEAL